MPTIKKKAFDPAESEELTARRLVGIEKKAFPAVFEGIKKTVDDYLSTLKTEDDLFAPYEPKPQADAEAALRAAITAAFAFGFNAGAPPQKQAAVTFADEPTFDAAINALVSKKVVSRATVDAMDEKAKSRAFYVSRLAELEAVERVKDYLVDNLKDKTSFQNFVKNLDKDELLKKAGWEENGGWYWETVYRTNTMSAFNAGRAEAFDEYEPEFLEFIGIEDFRQTPVCSARSGIVKKRTDPFWKKNFPPLHFNCRSTVRPVYAEEADAFGIKESADVSLPNAPAKGFGHNPAENWNGVTEEVKRRYERQKAAAENPLLPTAMSTP